MNIKTYEPKHPILKKYIAYYYETIIEDYSCLAFPHFYLPVSIISNSAVRVIKDEVIIKQVDKNPLSCFTYSKFTKPLKIKVIGRVSDFCIVFKSYGLVQFLPDLLDFPISEVSIKPLFKDLVVSGKEINFDTIENYLVSKLSEKKGTETIIKAMRILQKEEKISLKKLSELCNCHQKKLYRLFKTICGDSPVNFKKIIQFRKSLEKLKRTNTDFNLTDVALMSDYYDQPAFNNAFKKLTGDKPSNFFKSIATFSSKEIYFKNR